ncbi:MAG: hypothetical protein AB8B92_08150 [Gammaproteobacteria bacterium]
MKNNIEEHKKKVLTVYIVQCVSLVLPVAIFVVLYIHWRSKENLKDTWLGSHGDFQIKTAMIYLTVMLFVVVVMILGYGADHTSIKDLALLAGAFLFVGVINIWVLYRVFTGLMRFGDSNAIDKEISKKSPSKST